MKLPGYRRLFKGDYKPEFQGLIEKLATSVNIGIEVLYEALNRKLTLSDNLSTTVKDVIIIVNASGIPVTRTSFPLDLTTGVQGLQVIRAENLTNPTTYPTSGIFISYTQSGNNVIINHITGLQADNEYQIRVVAWHI